MKRERGCDGHINPSSPDEAGLPWGEGVHGHPFSHFIVEEVREVAGGGCGGDKVHLGSTTLSQGIDQSQVGRNICCVVSEQQDRLQERRGLEGCWTCLGRDVGIVVGGEFYI